MLAENIKTLRKAKGLTQEDLAVRLNVVRQTVSKWEQGRSVPDADLLLMLSRELDAPVSILLGETVDCVGPGELSAIAERLETIVVQLARRRDRERLAFFWTLVAVAVGVVAVFALLVNAGSPYLSWDLSDPETAVAATILHGFEWLFVRAAPLVCVAAVAGAVVLWRKRVG